jgi:hypothetical protein
MATRFNLIMATVAGTALVLVAVGFHQAGCARQADEIRLALASQQRGSYAAIARADQELADRESARKQLEKDAASLKNIVMVDAPAASVQQEEKKEQESVLNQEQRARGYRSRLVAEYAPFYLKIGLSPEQIDRFETILTDHWQSTEDITAVAEAKGLADHDQSVAKLREQATTSLQQAETELLSEDGYRQLQEYERTLPVRALTASLAERLYYTDAPLNGAQAERLTQILAGASKSYGEGAVADPEQIDWPAVLTQVQGILAPVQRSALEDQQQSIQGQKRFFEWAESRAKALFRDEAGRKNAGPDTRPGSSRASSTISVSAEPATP